MVIGNQSNRFSYESFYEEHLKFGIEIPFKGEETLFFKVGKPEGSIYKKVSSSLLKRRQINTLKAFNAFIEELSVFFDTVWSVQNNRCDTEKGCHFGTINDNSGEVTIIKKLNYQLNLHLNFSELKNFRYEKVQASLSRGDDGRILYKLSLRIDSCSE